jgi:crotonobetainyl-CoA:carnitine CoA-transferase CaiB-like acyl-CoA transferase
MSGPLTGVVVADFSQLAQGPFATQILGDLGADVIKIEPPAGDWMRRYALNNLYLAGESVSFLSFNRSKRSITINLKDERGLEIAHRILDRVDVVVENFRPGVMERLGLGYDCLAERNPRLIYCASSGFGPDGPYSGRPGQDLLIQAMTGLPYQNGRSGDPPTPVGLGIADLVAGHQILIGILAALYSRERTGRGQRVDVCLLNALLALQTQEFTTYLNGGGLPERSAKGIASPYTGAPYGLYRTADGYIAIAMNAVNRLARLLEVDGYEVYESNNVMEGRDEIRERLAQAFLQRTTEDWLTRLLAEDIWSAPLYTYEDVEHDPQVQANQMIVEFAHPTAGTVRAVGMPVKFGGTPGEISRPAPRLGEHSAELLRELAGYSESEARALQDAGVV